ncbi:MAG TPA: hypothetical protein DFR83_27570 [Deltaproteobacteria bacterium]|nr:hypothetical protein [Deltaproteobacteria bacterium]
MNAARRASLLDASAAHPFALMAQAHALLGDDAEALAAASAAVEHEPSVPALRLLRLRLQRDDAFTAADLDLLLAASSPIPDRVLNMVHAAAKRTGDRTAQVALETIARSRIRTAPTHHLESLMEVAAEGDGALALVVGGLRLHRAGEDTERSRALAVAGLAASAGSDPAWSPLPQHWRPTASSAAPIHGVGYERAPDNDAGWQQALAGQPVDALRHLTRMWTHHPHHPTVLEQIWLVQRREAVD